MNRNENMEATLIAHCGTSKVTREELIEIPVPEATRTHKPVAHFEVVETLEEALSFRHLKVVRDEYAVSRDGMKMFGVMDLDAEFMDCRFSIGLRNSNDKSMRLAMTAGYRVTVCDNMMFSGDFNPLSHKHTRNLELIDSITIAVDRIQRSFAPIKSQVEMMKALTLNDVIAKLIIYQAFLDKKIKGIPKHLMSVVHKNYFKPEYKEFEDRNLWSLSNAFTSAFKKLKPIRQFQTTARLGTFLTDVEDDLGQELDLYFNINEQNNQNGRESKAGKNIKANLKELSTNGNVVMMPNVNINSNDGINGIPINRESENEDFDIDDAREEMEEEFDEYFDLEEEDEHLEEVIERLEREEAKEEQRLKQVA